MTMQFEPVQRIVTSGARAAEPFSIDGELYLAIAQMAMDIPGQPAHMNAGSSRTVTPILRWQHDRFVPHAELSVPAGEDAEFFRIGERSFLATASLRTGDGPYVMDAQSVVFEWRDGGFEPFQSFPTFAAKQWRHFSIDGRHFLALAQGVVMNGLVASHPPQSSIFEWDGRRFAERQVIDSAWGYNWRHATVGGRHFVAYCDQVAPSRLFEWTGSHFKDFQELEGKSGRTTCFFESGGETWLAFANLLGESILYRWTGQQFERHQTFCGPGARELLWLPQDGGRLVQANFLLGSRDAPQVMTQSTVYSFQSGGLQPVASLESSAAVDVARFQSAGASYIVMANSLDAGLRFKTDSIVYRVREAADGSAALKP